MALPPLPPGKPPPFPMEAGFLNPCTSSASSCSTASSRSTIPRAPPISSSLVRPSHRHSHHSRGTRIVRSVFRSIPMFTPTCKLPAPISDDKGGSVLSGRRRSLHCSKITGTLFGYRKGRICLSMQENSMCLPSLVIELALPTHTLMKEMSAGLVRIALECEKGTEQRPGKLLDEQLWTMFFNGKKSGYGLKREPSEDDLGVMELLRGVSMGGGVLPGKSETEGPDGEVAYMRASFEHVVGSRDSETLYMFGPEGNNGPVLTIFFIRV